MPELGTFALEPLLIFYSAALDIKNLQDLKGLRLFVGPPEAGPRILAERILPEYGINAQNATFLPTILSEVPDAMRRGLGDAAFMTLPPNNHLPSAPPKETDRRRAHFNDTEIWQAEALDPNDLIASLEAAILAHLDRDTYDEVLAQEIATRAMLTVRLGL